VVDVGFADAAFEDKFVLLHCLCLYICALQVDPKEIYVETNEELYLQCFA